MGNYATDKRKLLVGALKRVLGVFLELGALLGAVLASAGWVYRVNAQELNFDAARNWHT